VLSGTPGQPQFYKASPNVYFSVLRAHDLPPRILPLGKKRRFYVTLTDGSTIKKTAAIQSEERAVEWNEKLDAL
jgi:hypothetical protein